MKAKLLIVLTVVVISGCVLSKSDKTPLSPHGQLNVCLRDEINKMRIDGRLNDLGKAAAAHKAARICLDELKMADAFSQNMAYRNADYLLSESDGISLK